MTTEQEWKLSVSPHLGSIRVQNTPPKRLIVLPVPPGDQSQDHLKEQRKVKGAP